MFQMKRVFPGAVMATIGAFETVHLHGDRLRTPSSFVSAVIDGWPVRNSSVQVAPDTEATVGAGRAGGELIGPFDETKQCTPLLKTTTPPIHSSKALP